MCGALTQRRHANAPSAKQLTRRQACPAACIYWYLCGDLRSWREGVTGDWHLMNDGGSALSCCAVHVRIFRRGAAITCARLMPWCGGNVCGDRRLARKGRALDITPSSTASFALNVWSISVYVIMHELLCPDGMCGPSGSSCHGASRTAFT